MNSKKIRKKIIKEFAENFYNLFEDDKQKYTNEEIDIIVKIQNDIMKKYEIDFDERENLFDSCLYDYDFIRNEGKNKNE